MSRRVRIGCASGFWGDSAIAVPQLVERGEVQYLVSDYLAELTLSIMAAARLRSPEAGYARDWVSALRPVLPVIAARGIKVVSNAGGLNPQACREALRRACREAGVELLIAVVTGDDLLPRRDAFAAAGVREMFTGAPIPANLTSMNAYLGAGGIAAALRAGADVVITGRVVDSALVLGPLLHEHGWALDDWDRLASGSLAGHVLECGAQCTGGNFTDWRRVPDYEHIGFPIAEVDEDGGFVVTKPPGTGGLVTRGTVGEQIVYEIGDPRAYVLPDAVCDFSGVRLDEVGPDAVRVAGARGLPSPREYKVAATWADGYRCTGMVAVVGADAAAKARRVGEAILARTAELNAEEGLAPFRETIVELLGAEAMYGGHGGRARDPGGREVVLRLGATHDRKEALERLASEIAPFFTGGPPGMTTLFGGRPAVSPVLRLWSCLVPKADVEVRVDVEGAQSLVAMPPGRATARPEPEEAGSARRRGEGGARAILEGRAPDRGDNSSARAEPVEARADVLTPLPPCTESLPLVALAWARSGDKGDHANVGVLARRPEYLPFLRAALTPEAVARHMAHALDPERGRVRRWELPGLDGMNFLLEHALGGGGMASLRSDPQGKGFAQQLLDLAIPVTAEIARRVREEER